MKAVILWVLVLYSGSLHAQQELWYRVVESDNHMWDTTGNMFITPLGEDSVYILGFSDHGAGVTGSISNGVVDVPLQTRHITPHGFAKIEWDITVSAHGNIVGDVMSLQFTFRKDTFETTGNIKAVKWSSQQEEERLRAGGVHIDTTIDDVVYAVGLYDAASKLTAVGQSFTDKIKTVIGCIIMSRENWPVRLTM